MIIIFVLLIIREKRDPRVREKFLKMKKKLIQTKDGLYFTEKASIYNEWSTPRNWFGKKPFRDDEEYLSLYGWQG